MHLIITTATSVISDVLAVILQAVLRENMKLKRKKDENAQERERALENGVRQLLSVRLEELYDQYAESEYIPRRAYDRWMKLHAAYKGLNGNGTFDHMKIELEEKHITNK